MEKNRYLPGLTLMLLAVVAIWWGTTYGPYLGNRDHYRNVRSLQLALNAIYENNVEPVAEEALVRAAIDGMTRSLGDPYSQVLSAEEFETLQEDVKGEFGGIGVEVRYRPDTGDFIVNELVENGPAMKSGIIIGDVIFKVNSVLCRDMGQIKSLSNIRGIIGTSVNIGIMRNVNNINNELYYNIMRDKILLQSVRLAESDENGIMVLKISGFDTHTPDMLREKLSGLKNCRGLIVDLRDNGGGELNAAREVADHFLDSGVIYTVIERGGEVTEIARATKGTVVDPQIPIVVLVNDSSASASEIVASALQDNGRAKLVGYQTFGKGTIIQPMRLPNRMGLILAVSYYATPSGKRIEGIGLHPDIEAGDPALRQELRRMSLEGGNFDPSSLPPNYLEQRKASDAEQMRIAKEYLLHFKADSQDKIQLEQK
ncbi:MAG TPA: S41 family peptidase [Candidatus Brocadiia bacterium]|nr:S41 family peptidase [Candidatus Brocadiia bacterium]